MSALVTALLWQIKAAKLPAPVQEHRFAPPRRWRFDLCWPKKMLAVEVEGGVWTRGRHSRGKGMVADMEKYAEAAIRGWMLIRVSGDMIKSGKALSLIERAMDAEKRPRSIPGESR